MMMTWQLLMPESLTGCQLLLVLLARAAVMISVLKPQPNSCTAAATATPIPMQYHNVVMYWRGTVCQLTRLSIHMWISRSIYMWERVLKDYIIIRRRSGINPIPPTVKDRD